ncbi:hypothetical protein ATR1_369c0002, partial [Acetobacter tropicalis]
MQQIKAFLPYKLWQNCLIQQGFNAFDMRNPLWHDETEFIQNGTQGIHQFRALVHQTLAGAKENASGLLRLSA